jgi:hypothetical protein
MLDPTASIGYQTVPAGAGANEPSIGFGVVPIPAELVTFYAVELATVNAVIIERRDATTYLYDALITLPTLAPARVLGACFLGTVSETVRYTINAGTAWGVRNSGIITFDNTGVADFRAPFRLQIGDGGPAFLMRTLSGEGASLAGAGQVGNRNNATFANLPGNPSKSIRKLYDGAETDLKCVYTVSGFSAAVGTRMDIAVNDGAGPDKGGQLFFNTAGVHTSIPGLSRLMGRAAGNYTINLQWASTALVQQDTNDWVTLDIVEVPVQ